MKHKRCPKGYHIKRWSDGLYHVYDPSGECLSELSGRQEGIDLAWKDFISKPAYQQRRPKMPTSLESVERVLYDGPSGHVKITATATDNLEQAKRCGVEDYLRCKVSAFVLTDNIAQAELMAGTIKRACEIARRLNAERGL